MSNVLITGANRGLGLEFAKQYLKDGWHVIATCRYLEKAKELKNLQKEYSSALDLYSLDVVSEKSLADLDRQLKQTSLDLLINNAGIYLGQEEGVGSLNVEKWIQTMHCNAIAPLKLTQILLERLMKGEKKCVVMITSKMGSVSDNASGGSYYYRSSKSALNMASKSLSIDLLPLGITVLLLHPGWVKTDMGGPNALITPQESISGMKKVIASATVSDTGKFSSFDGSPIPW